MRQHGQVPGGNHPAALLEEVSLTLSSYYLTYTDRTQAQAEGICRELGEE